MTESIFRSLVTVLDIIVLDVIVLDVTVCDVIVRHNSEFIFSPYSATTS